MVYGPHTSGKIQDLDGHTYLTVENKFFGAALLFITAQALKSIGFPDRATVDGG